MTQYLIKCDKCGKDNPNKEWSNYCDDCRAAYHNRINEQTETRPIGDGCLHYYIFIPGGSYVCEKCGQKS
jgi:hypothetical protein